MLGISALQSYWLEALEAECLNKHDMLVCVLANLERKSCIFQRDQHSDGPFHATGREQEQFSVAPVTDQICSVLKSSPVILWLDQISSHGVAVQ